MLGRPRAKVFKRRRGAQPGSSKEAHQSTSESLVSRAEAERAPEVCSKHLAKGTSQKLLVNSGGPGSGRLRLHWSLFLAPFAVLALLTARPVLGRRKGSSVSFGSPSDSFGAKCVALWMMRSCIKQGSSQLSVFGAARGWNQRCPF